MLYTAPQGGEYNMAVFRVSSGGLDKNITHNTHELAAVEALAQWVICTTCALGEVLSVVDSDNYEVWFHTETLLVGMGVEFRMIDKNRIIPRLMDFKFVVC
jgi:hypothetical protein